MTKLISIAMIVAVLFSCSIDNQNNDDQLSNGQSSGMKFFNNLGVSMLYPKSFKEIRDQYSCTFMRSDENEVYIVAIYPNQTSEQVIEFVKKSINQNGYRISVTSDFAHSTSGFQSAEAKTEVGNSSYPGYMIIRTLSTGNTYLSYGCVTNVSEVEKMKSSLSEMALSMDVSKNNASQPNTGDIGNLSNGERSVTSYQQFLMDKALVNSKQSRDMISTDDWQQSHGKWIASEDVQKTRRMVLCAGGFGYFRFISTGHQMTGDYGTFELDKFSGYWKVIENNGKIGIYMEDERNGNNRFWEINDLRNNIIIIDNRPYEIFTQEQSGNECRRPDGKVVVPE